MYQSEEQDIVYLIDEIEQVKKYTIDEIEQDIVYLIDEIEQVKKNTIDETSEEVYDR